MAHQKKEPRLAARLSTSSGPAAESGDAPYSAFSPAGKPGRLFRRVGLGGTECRPRDEATAAALADIVNGLARCAYAEQGERAFEATRRAAAVHEAGHAVEAELVGRPARSARVRRRWVGGRAQWVGVTNYDRGGGPRMITSPTSAADDDVRHARLAIAGVLAELLFDPDFRSGSSLDEVATVNVIVANAAAKVGAPAEDLFFAIIDRVIGDLETNSATVLAVADRLEQQCTLDRPALRSLLRGARP